MHLLPSPTPRLVPWQLRLELVSRELKSMYNSGSARIQINGHFRRDTDNPQPMLASWL